MSEQGACPAHHDLYGPCVLATPHTTHHGEITAENGWSASGWWLEPVRTS